MPDAPPTPHVAARAVAGVVNPARRSVDAVSCFSAADVDAAGAYYQACAAPATPLARLPALAHRLGVRGLAVKNESCRFGVNAFKITGVRYAVDRHLHDAGSGATLACVSTGNHGRAVARVAAERGFTAHVVVPAGTAPARVEAIAREGAHVVVSPHGYDDAVTALAREAPARGWTIVSDTSWPGYESIPRDIMAGYTQLLQEAGRQWPSTPDVVLVQAGVGGIAAAVVGWLALEFGRHRPFTIVCEPAGAACLLASARAGARVALSGALHTHMAGLKCAEPSPLAWETVGALADAFVAVPDALVERMMRRLANPLEGDPVIEAGSSGACGLAALEAVLDHPALVDVRRAARLGPASEVFAIVTEGATDPELWTQVVGRPPRTPPDADENAGSAAPRSRS